MESPVWTPIGSKFSIEQMTTQLSARSRMTSISNSFQPEQRLSSMSTSLDRRHARDLAGGDRPQTQLFIVRDPTALSRPG